MKNPWNFEGLTMGYLVMAGNKDSWRVSEYALLLLAKKSSLYFFCIFFFNFLNSHAFKIPIFFFFK